MAAFALMCSVMGALEGKGKPPLSLLLPLLGVVRGNFECLCSSQHQRYLSLI